MSRLITASSVARECSGQPVPASETVIERISELVAMAGFRVTYEGLFGVKFTGTAEQFEETFGLIPGITLTTDLTEDQGELGELISKITLERH